MALAWSPWAPPACTPSELRRLADRTFALSLSSASEALSSARCRAYAGAVPVTNAGLPGNAKYLLGKA